MITLGARYGENSAPSDYMPVLENQQNFVTHGALSGKSNPDRNLVGRLPQEYHESFRTAVYAVYSWATPIAWVDGARNWTVPNHGYSKSTTQHQNKIRSALNLFTEFGTE